MPQVDSVDCKAPPDHFISGVQQINLFLIYFENSWQSYTQEWSVYPFLNSNYYYIPGPDVIIKNNTL
jgi:hypothetical protein